MHKKTITERVGNYVVTPLTRINDTGTVTASVSIRRGMYDRVFRFVRPFDSTAAALRYALDQGRQMAACGQLN